MLTIEELRRVLAYSDGSLTWRVRVGQACRAGERAGALKLSGYRRVTYLGKAYQEHILVFAIVRGRWPSSDLDHINGRKDDNRIENLREVTDSQNQQNRHRPRSNSTSGVTGVGFDGGRGKWRARLKLNGRQLHIGYFDDIAAASAARRQAERRHFTHAPQKGI